MVGDKSTIEKSTVKCPFCQKGDIDITEYSAYYSNTYARAFGKVKKIPLYHEGHIEVHNKCSNCGKSKSELKEVIEKGKTKVMTHEERIAMYKKRGLPLVIGGK
ncbi:MAG: hypothetical protein KAW40_03625 [Candidatus Aenigmarchaeota archaeon]|nr:hypothetical protein [Candidatus Aenigmarchaeota archaeon]